MGKKMTIEEAANHFGISKEAIHNRIRRGTLQVVLEGDVKYVLIDPTFTKPKIKQQRSVDLYADKLYNVLEEQNKELRQKVEQLQNETRRLREEKEQLLIEERERIEQIYKEKDEQLKNILSTISSQFLLEAKPLDVVEDEEHFEAEIEERKPPKPVSLKKHLKNLKIGSKKREKILKKVKKVAKKEDRFTVEKKKIYIDLTLYDYSDLF